MKYLFLVLFAIGSHFVSQAQLITATRVSIEQNGMMSGLPGTVFPPLFEAKLTGFPTSGPGAVPGGIKYPLYVTYTGRVGVGTNNPVVSLDVLGTIRAVNETTNDTYLQTFSRGNLTLTMDGNPVSRGLFIKSPSGDVFSVTQEMILFTDGTTDFMKVDNLGQLYARKMIVTLTNPFPDYVFEKEYKLMPLDDLGLFIQKNKHLPNMPSAEEVAANNKQMELGEMQVKLLEKVEELTLYILQQQQEIDELKAKLGIN